MYPISPAPLATPINFVYTCFGVAALHFVTSLAQATEGLVGVVLDGDNEAAMVQVTCETDFSARNETMQEFVAAAARACLDRVPLPPAPGVHSVTLDALLAQPLDPSVSSVDHAKATPGTSLSVKVVSRCRKSRVRCLEQ